MERARSNSTLSNVTLRMFCNTKLGVPTSQARPSSYLTGPQLSSMPIADTPLLIWSLPTDKERICECDTPVLSQLEEHALAALHIYTSAFCDLVENLTLEQSAIGDTAGAQPKPTGQSIGTIKLEGIENHNTGEQKSDCIPPTTTAIPPPI